MCSSDLLPFLANSAGWLFTETARQPWLVFGLLRTRDGVSEGVGTGTVLTSLIGFTLLYAALGAVAVKLFLRIGPQGPDGLLAPHADPWLAAHPDHDDRHEPTLVDQPA